MRVLLPVLLAATAVPAFAQTPSAERTVAEVADAFTRAIVEHDSAAAAVLLADAALILEGGAIETRSEYLAHHFHADAEFLGSVDREPISRTVRVSVEAAWVLSTSHLSGTFRDRDVDAVSAETLILVREEAGWKIASVHWSSGARR